MRKSRNRILNDQEEPIYFRVGTGSGGYQVAMSNNVPQEFEANICLNAEPTDYARFYQSNETKYFVLIEPRIENITLQDSSVVSLGQDIQLVRKNKMTRTPNKPSESDNDRLIRDIRDTKIGVLTINIVEDGEGIPDLQILHCTDITSQIGFQP